MDVIYPRCAGLDVHKKTVRVCLLLRQENGKNDTHRILVILYHLLRDGVPYEEKGETFLEERDRELMEKRLVRQLERLGNQVTVQPLAQAG